METKITSTYHFQISQGPAIQKHYMHFDKFWRISHHHHLFPQKEHPPRSFRPVVGCSQADFTHFFQLGIQDFQQFLPILRLDPRQQNPHGILCVARTSSSFMIGKKLVKNASMFPTPLRIQKNKKTFWEDDWGGRSNQASKGSIEGDWIGSLRIWVFPKIGLPQNGWFIMENLIKMDDLGGTTIFGNIHMFCHMFLVQLSSHCSVP